MRICFIGGRDLTQPPPDTVALYRTAAAAFARQGHTVVTLPQRGACQLAVEAALVVGGRVEVLLSPLTDDAGWLNAMRREHGGRLTVVTWDAEDAEHQGWVAAGCLLNPYWKELGHPDDAYHACVYGCVERGEVAIVLPRTTELSADGTPCGYEAAPAIRIARALGKPLLVLTDEVDRAELETML